MPGGPTILHADLDAFYASVEQLLDPGAARPADRRRRQRRGGVVLAASYEAKALRRAGRHAGLAGPAALPGADVRRGATSASTSGSPTT